MHRLKDVFTDGTIISLSGIENKRLNSLDLNASKLHSLEPLRNMTIDYLRLSNLSFSDIEVLSTMMIKQLSLPMGRHIKDLSPIAKIKKLEFLDIKGTGVKDLSPLESTNIEKLYINKTQVDSLAPLYKMRKLKMVIINKNVPALLNMTDAERKEFKIQFHKSSRIHTGDNANFYFKRPLSPQEKKNEGM
jgi:Leucine-rich repeat (LRR) protein